jgi:hypothetical protein
MLCDQFNGLPGACEARIGKQSLFAYPIADYEETGHVINLRAWPPVCAPALSRR